MAALTKARWGTLFPHTIDRDMHQLFENLFQNGGERGWFAPAALWEEGECFYVEADLPGVKREDVEVTLEKNVLKIAATRQPPAGERTYWHNERGIGRIERTVSLPENVDAESISAELKDGVLYLQLRKRPESLPRKIEVRG